MIWCGWGLERLPHASSITATHPTPHLHNLEDQFEGGEVVSLPPLLGGTQLLSGVLPVALIEDLRELGDLRILHRVGAEALF